MKRTKNFILYIQDTLDSDAISEKSLKLFTKVIVFQEAKEIVLNENDKTAFILEPKFCVDNPILVHQINLSLQFSSITLVYDDILELNQVLQLKEVFFSSFIKKSDFATVIDPVIKNGLLRSEELEKTKDKLTETENFKNEILKIGSKIGSEKDANKLLNEILIQSMKLVRADAGSLAVLGFDKELKRADKNLLTFYASKNMSKEINFNRFSFKISNQSLAGYAIIARKTLNIDDVYKINDNEVYTFNKEFDQKTKFRTKSILVIPMIDHKNEVFGVIQLINKKDSFDKIINYDDPNSIKEITTFKRSDVNDMKSLASFLAVSLENAILYNEIDELFNSFVQASVSAVEQRDPVTSGHSLRVSKYSTSLAEACNLAKGALEDYNFNPQQIRELRYAALLHDFGKIGVRENVLTKSKKLSDLQIEKIFNRIDLYIYQLKLNAEREKMKLVTEARVPASDLKNRMTLIDKDLERSIRKIIEKKEVITKANIPSVLEEKASELLAEYNKITLETDGGGIDLLSDEDFKFLSIPRGNLTHEERTEIESHVSHTYNFLKKIPWTKDLNFVPEIAYGHHEKLDGSGYPLKKKAEDILPQTKIMTISDIFDALTAADRPYKKALSVNRAIDILYLEANEGKLDKNLVDYFIKSKSFRIN